MKLIKEVCEPCSKPINIGQPLLECEACRVAIHTKCFKKAGFCPSNGLWVCKICSMNFTPRYNPFSDLMCDENDKFYDDEGTCDQEVIQQISKVLDLCQGYSTTELNTAVKDFPKTTSFSSFFINLDGNKTNFNSLSVEMKRIEHTFSVIGIAETNTDEPLKDLYNIPLYNSFYQTTQQDKLKGTGVAIYVLESLNAEILEHVGYSTADIESVFVKITLPSSKHNLISGVIYRPPNGNFNNFLEKFDLICQSLPKHGVRIMGDFNIDLLKMCDNSGHGNHSLFEEIIFKNGYAPLISIPTHKRPNCKPSCIDNISIFSQYRRFTNFLCNKSPFCCY